MSLPPRPTLCAHHGRRSWTTKWYSAPGLGRTKRFGREGEVTRDQAEAAFEKWLNDEWKEKPHVKDPNVVPTSVTDLCRAYKARIAQIHIKDGKPTSYVGEVATALESVAVMYGPIPADDVSAPMLSRWVASISPGRTARTVNGRLSTVKAMFAWGRGQGLVCRATAADVELVAPVRVLEHGARPSGRVLPVDERVVEDTLPHLDQVVADVVRVQLLTGMRPNEVCIMRPVDISFEGDTWRYMPARHKTQHKGKSRVVSIGTQAQAIILKYLNRPTTDFLFGRLTERSYCDRIRRACERGGIDVWTPNQLRHTAATKIDKMFGADAARAVLGHASVKMTENYIERDNSTAARVAGAIG